MLGSGAATLWAEQLSANAPDVDVLLRYGKSNGWLDDQPAMITRRVGKGRITYLGAVLDPDLMRKVVAWAAGDVQVEAEFPVVPADVEVCRRADANRTVFVLINHGLPGQDSTAVHVALPSAMNDVLQANRRVTSVDLEPQGVAVLETDAP
jgi:beta-galactosidase